MQNNYHNPAKYIKKVSSELELFNPRNLDSLAAERYIRYAEKKVALYRELCK
jgi:hypothetical protein